MALNKDLKIIIVQSEQCNYVSIKDVSNWETSNLPESRLDMALALFYTNNDKNISGCDLSNPGEGWEINIDSLGQYEFYMYACPIWTAGSYEQDSIVYHKNKFWRCIAVSPTLSEPEEGNDWEILGCNNKDNFDNSSQDNFYSCIGIYSSNCISAKLFHTGCNEWTLNASAITDLVDDTAKSPVLIKIWNLAKSCCLGWRYIDTRMGRKNTIIRLSQDGIFIAEVGFGKYNDDDEIIEDGEFDTSYPHRKEYILYAICGIESCWVNLNKAMLCNPLDICNSTGCDLEELEYRDNMRYDLNAMTSLWTNLMSYMEVEQGQYMNLSVIYNINGEVQYPERMKYLLYIQDILEAMYNIVDRCGMCKDDVISNLRTGIKLKIASVNTFDTDIVLPEEEDDDENSIHYELIVNKCLIPPYPTCGRTPQSGYPFGSECYCNLLMYSEPLKYSVSHCTCIPYILGNINIIPL